jgi:hypothetical protein
MKKMQSWCLKNVAICIGLIITTFQLSAAQSNQSILKTADSLYVAGRFTQSFQQYETLLEKRIYTPAMLLKMAYIQEGLGNIGKALYHLNLYYLASNDKEVLFKMEELAEKYNLDGYAASDKEHFLSFYHDYYSYISLVLAAILIFALSAIFYTRVKLRKRPIAGPIALMVIVIAFAIHLNMGERVSSAILTAKRAYIMTGPSAAAPLLTITGEGHRVEVIGKRDVWMKILWNGQIGYVRDQMLQPIEL